jgi:hypothetical protein
VPLRDWFHSPRSLLTLYLAGAAMAVACLVWLAVRQLHQEAALDAQRTTDRLQGAASLAAARSQQALVDLERLLATEKHVGKDRDDVLLIPIDGGAPVKLDLPGARWGWMAMHPDGKRIAYLAGKQEEEVWVIENFLPQAKAAIR